MADPDPTDNAARIALARDNLAAKLGELRRREAHARTALSPVRYLANPWLYVGLAAAIGYRLGRPAVIHSPVQITPAAPETLIHTIVRASVFAIAQALVRKAVVALVDEL